MESTYNNRKQREKQDTLLAILPLILERSITVTGHENIFSWEIKRLYEFQMTVSVVNGCDMIIYKKTAHINITHSNK